MEDDAEGLTTASTMVGDADGERWRGIGRALRDDLQLEVARRRARAGLFEEPEGGVALGRYVVLGRIGHGGMGVVYAAFDPRLDRKIALKVLYVDGGGDPEDRHRRLLREAQALAQLTHPNVVAIHDVGTFESSRSGAEAGTTASVFIAMEYVEGETLTRWLSRSRPWHEVLDVLVQAARGLSAAHAKGLVHRDFKPDNVMVGVDGRARVMDFGLARTTAPPSSSERDAGHPSRLLEVTTASTRVGTPAYMAPEQHAGLPADARSDQFAFCVATWEAICGERPFAGDAVVELATSVIEGRLRDWPRSAGAPAWLRRALERGLATQPEARWRSMDELVSALERGRALAGRRRLAFVVIGCAGVALAAFAGRALLRFQQQRECDAAAAMTDVWNDETRAQVRDAILSTGVSYAPTTAERVIPRLDAFATGWTDARASACRAREVEGTWDADTYARSLWCFDERRMDLEALVGELVHADPKAVRAAISAAANLPDVAACTDAPRLHRLPAPTREREDLVSAVRGDLARSWAAAASGRPSEARARAEAALDQVRDLGAPRLFAAARLAMGTALDQQGDHAQAVAALREAYFGAAEAGEVDLAGSSAAALARILGTSLGAPDDAETWMRLAEVEDSRMADAEGLRDAARLTTRGSIRARAGDYQAARLDHQRALEILERVAGEEHPEFARALQGLATTELELGHYDEARTLQQRGYEVLEGALGADHPDVASVLVNLAASEIALGRYAEADEQYTRAAALIEAALGSQHPALVSVFANQATARRSMGRSGEARQLLERALAVAESAYGIDHARTAAVLNNLAVVDEADGRWEQALALHERALAIRQRVLPPGHADIARSLANVALAREETGDVAGALASYEQALPALEAALGPDHTDLAQVVSNLAILRGHEGQHRESLALHRRALGIWERAVGREHPDVALALTALGKELTADGQASAAIEPLRRAATIRERPPIDPSALAETRFALASALWIADVDRRGAIDLAHDALAAYEAAGAARRDAATEVARWVAAHERR